MVKLTQILIEIREKINSIISKIEDIVRRVNSLVIEVWGNVFGTGESRITKLERQTRQLETDLKAHTHKDKDIIIQIGQIPQYLRDNRISDVLELATEYMAHKKVKTVPPSDTIPPDISNFYVDPGTGGGGVAWSHWVDAIKWGPDLSTREFIEAYILPYLLKKGSIKIEHFPNNSLVFSLTNVDFSATDTNTFKFNKVLTFNEYGDTFQIAVFIETNSDVTPPPTWNLLYNVILTRVDLTPSLSYQIIENVGNIGGGERKIFKKDIGMSDIENSLRSDLYGKNIWCCLEITLTKQGASGSIVGNISLYQIRKSFK